MITITDKTQFDDVGENKIIHGDINNIEFEQSLPLTVQTT